MLPRYKLQLVHSDLSSAENEAIHSFVSSLSIKLITLWTFCFQQVLPTHKLQPVHSDLLRPQNETVHGFICSHTLNTSILDGVEIAPSMVSLQHGVVMYPLMVL